MSEQIAKGSGVKNILKLALPLILQQLTVQLQIWADRAMLGHVNAEFFSAVGNVLVPYYAVSSIILAISGGTTILVAQSIGAKNADKSRCYAECSFMGNSVFSLLAFAFFFFASGLVFGIMGVQSPILEYSTVYLKILSFNLIILGFTSTANSVLQGIGITKMIMIAGVLSNVINIVLDWLLIFGKFGFPQLGIEGAAYATTIANFVTAPLMIGYVFAGRKMPFKIRIKNVLKFRFDLYKEVLKVGVPSGMEYALWNIGNLVAVSFLNRVDTVSAGIYTLVFSIESFPLMLYMGFANAGLTLVGQKTGENEHKQALGVGFKCLAFALVICAVMGVVFWLFPRQILSIFTDDQAVITMSVPYLMFISFILLPKAVNNVIGLGIRGLGDTKWMLYGQILGTVLVIVLSYLLIFTAEKGLMGLFITLLVDETVRSIFNILRFWRGREFFRLKPFEKTL